MTMFNYDYKIAPHTIAHPMTLRKRKLRLDGSYELIQSENDIVESEDDIVQFENGSEVDPSQYMFF